MPTTDVQALARKAGGSDADAGLRAAVALRHLGEQLELLQVANARRQHWSWQDIADVLQVSRQAVHKKYSRLVPDWKD
jgi:hypothetical protein